VKIPRAARALLFALLCVAATPLWLPLLGTALVVADPLAPADAVVPLAGDLGERVASAAELLHAGFAPRLVLSDLRVDDDGALTSKDHRRFALDAGVQPGRLFPIDRTVRSTYQELVAVRELATRSGWRSLIVVTSPQHTRRTRLIAAEVFRDSSIAVHVRPVEGFGYTPSRWWQSDRERTLTLGEYPKLLAFLLGYRG